MIVNFFFKEAREFKLNIWLKTVIATDMEILALGYFGTKSNIVHG